MNLSGEQAQAVLRLFGYGLLVSLILLTPVFPASAVVREKQQRTLELLLNSPLTPWSIFLGKTGGVAGIYRAAAAVERSRRRRRASRWAASDTLPRCSTFI